MINTKKLTLSAIFIALSTVLSLITIIKMPMGGTVTPFSMLPVILLAIIYGTPWGLFCCFVYAIIQLALGLSDILSWGLTPAVLIGSIILDYLVPFTLLGLAGVFRKKGAIGIIGGTVMVVFIRFCCHFLSGYILFATFADNMTPFVYSLVYNGSYMLPELILTTLGAFVLYQTKALEKILNLTAQ